MQTYLERHMTRGEILLGEVNSTNLKDHDIALEHDEPQHALTVLNKYSGKIFLTRESPYMETRQMFRFYVEVNSNVGIVIELEHFKASVWFRVGKVALINLIAQKWGLFVQHEPCVLNWTEIEFALDTVMLINDTFVLK